MNLGAMKILVVDDSFTMRRIVKQVLTSIGAQDFIEAKDGLDALAKLKENKIDLILTDWNMPEMDGMTFVKTVKATEHYKDIPIIMVTTESGKAEVVAALQEGVRDYVVKPFTPDVIQTKLEKIFQ